MLSGPQWIPALFRGLVARWFSSARCFREYRMVGNARRLAKPACAAVRGGVGYQVRFRDFAGEDHITALPPASVGRAFDFVLRA